MSIRKPLLAEAKRRARREASQAILRDLALQARQRKLREAADLCHGLPRFLLRARAVGLGVIRYTSVL